MMAIATDAALICSWVAVGVGLLLSYVLYARMKDGGYWRKVGVRSTNFLVGNTLQFFAGWKHLALVVHEIYEAFPDEPFVGYHELRSPVLLVKDPALIGAILRKDFAFVRDRLPAGLHTPRLAHNLLFLQGDRWMRVRRKLVSMFTPSKLESMFAHADRNARILEARLSSSASCWKEGGDAVNMEEAISRYVIDVMASVSFGCDFNTLAEERSAFRSLTYRMHMPSLRVCAVRLLKGLAPSLATLLGLTVTAPQAEPFFVRLLDACRKLRASRSVSPVTFAQLMLDIRERESAASSSHGADAEPAQPLFDDDVILSNMFSLYLVGFQTTYLTLNYCLYELALHPHVQSRLRREIRVALALNGGTLTYQMLPSMTYMQMVLSETLRMHNPIATVNRIVSEPYQLPGTSIVLTPGTRIRFPFFSINHDERYYPRPHEFDPERFDEANVKTRPPHLYLPFGDGPRTCIGTRLAKDTIKVCLARLLLKYEFGTCASTVTPIEINPRSLLFQPKSDIWLRVSKVADDDG